MLMKRPFMRTSAHKFNFLTLLPPSNCSCSGGGGGRGHFSPPDFVILIQPILRVFACHSVIQNFSGQTFHYVTLTCPKVFMNIRFEPTANVCFRVVQVSYPSTERK